MATDDVFQDDVEMELPTENGHAMVCRADDVNSPGTRTGRTVDGRHFVSFEEGLVEASVHLFDTESDLARFLWEQAEGYDAPLCLTLLFRMGRLRLKEGD